MNYEEMSDGAINLEVHYLANDIPKHHAVIMTKDYCNNPSDAWPIITENEMKIDPRRSSPKLDWMVSRDDQIYAVSKNPLRAAMICFLKIKDAENG